MYRKCRRKHWIPSPSLRATASIWPSGLSWLACFKDLASTKTRGNSMISWRKPRPQQSWDSTTESGCLTAPKNLHVRFLVLHLAHTPTKRHAESESHRISTTFWVFSRVIEITEPRIKCIKYLSLFLYPLVLQRAADLWRAKHRRKFLLLLRIHLHLIAGVTGGFKVQHDVAILGHQRLTATHWPGPVYRFIMIHIPSGNLTYWKWPLIVDFPTKYGDFQ